MVRSMTGYSRVQSVTGELSLAVSVRSINHRFLDVQVRLPATLESLEPRLRRLVKEHVARGRIELSVSLEQPGSSELRLDRKLLAAYVAACRELRAEYGFAVDPDPVALLRIPGVVTAANGEIAPEDLPGIQESLERAATEALTDLNRMRAREGEVLEQDLRARLKSLESLSEEVGKLAASLPLYYRRRLETRVQEILGTLGLDQARLAQEVAYLASRSDITEELARLRSHLGQARGLLGEKSELGKKLDFLLQEMHREVNTLLAKTTDVPEVGLQIGRHAIEMKAEIEKLREQAQNIE